MTPDTNRSDQSGASLTRGIGLPGRVTVSFGVGGGILLGGFLVAWMTLAGKLSGSGLLLATTGLFGLGALFGLLHGGLLGLLGRPDEMTRREAGWAIGKSLLYAIPALAVGWLVAGWISMTIMAAHLGQLIPWLGVGVGWTVGVFLLWVTGSYGLRGLKRAYARWPQYRVGTALTAASFMALLYIFWVGQPAALFGFRFELTEVGAVLAAGLSTLWIVGPLVTLALRGLEQLEGAPVPAFRPTEDKKALALNAGLGLVVGLVLAVLALPFYGPPLQVPFPVEGGPGMALGFALSHAVLYEVLLRLGAVSLLAWGLYRLYRAQPTRAALWAVLGVAGLQLVLFLPVLLSIGFPTTAQMVGFGAATVVIPALVLGALFWRRGLSAAITAEGTALMVLVLLA